MKIRSFVTAASIVLTALITQPALAGNSSSCEGAKAAKLMALEDVHRAISEHGQNSRQAFEAIREYAAAAQNAANVCGGAL